MKSKKVQGTFGETFILALFVLICLLFTKQCLRFLLIFFAREIKSFHQISWKNEMDFHGHDQKSRLKIKFQKTEILTVCSHLVTYALPRKSTFYSCMIVKELLARNRHDIWSLSDSNGIRTHNHLVHKRSLSRLTKLTSLAKWLTTHLRTKWLWLRIPLKSLKLRNCFLDETPMITTTLTYFCHWKTLVPLLVK